MPEWVYNEITVSGDDSIVDTLVHAMANPEEDTAFDFNRVIPMPNWITDTAGKAPNPFDWREAHWGTSRNAIVIDWKRDLGSAMYKLNTAWSAPYGVAKELRSLFPTLRVTWTCTFPGNPKVVEI
jgi:hypothetical protein